MPAQGYRAAQQRFWGACGIEPIRQVLSPHRRPAPGIPAQAFPLKDHTHSRALKRVAQELSAVCTATSVLDSLCAMQQLQGL